MSPKLACRLYCCRHIISDFSDMIDIPTRGEIEKYTVTEPKTTRSPSKFSKEITGAANDLSVQSVQVPCIKLFLHLRLTNPFSRWHEWYPHWGTAIRQFEASHDAKIVLQENVIFRLYSTNYVTLFGKKLAYFLSQNNLGLWPAEVWLEKGSPQFHENG